MYQKADQELKKLLALIRREANRLDVMGFDELTTPRVAKETKAMMTRLKKANEKAYLRVSNEAYDRAFEELLLLGYLLDDEDLDAGWVDGILAAYNVVTGYLYGPESERKRLRLSEEIGTARAYLDRTIYHKSIRTFANLWYTQTSQYMDTMVDAATLEAYKKADVKYVKWVAEKDEKTCEICKDRDGRIYRLGRQPHKPHYHCRCTLAPMPPGYTPYDGNNSDG